MKRQCLEISPPLVRLPTELLRLVVMFAEDSLPRILELQLISKYFRKVMRAPKMVEHVRVVLQKPSDVSQLGELAAGVRKVRFASAASLRLVKTMSSLRDLDLSHCALVNNESLALVGTLPRLETLNVKSCQKISDFSPLASWTSLRNLDMTCCYHVVCVPPLRHLQRLDMNGCNGLRQWNALSGMFELEFLSLSGCVVTDEDVRHLPTSLTDLNLGFCSKLTDLALVEVARSRSLQHLNLSGCTRVTNLDALANLRSMLSLRLVFCFGLTQINAVATMPRLQCINAPHAEVTCQGLVRGLNGLSELYELELSHSRQTHVGFGGPLLALNKLELRSCLMLHDLGALQFAKNLRVLDLNGSTQINDRSLESLEHTLGLTHLNLNSCTEITDVGLSHVGQLRNLRRLALSGCSLIKNHGMVHVAKLTKLEALDLQGCLMVTDAGLHLLSVLVRMRSLTLGRLVGMTDAGLFAVASMPELHSLNLDGCRKVTDVGLHALASLKNLCNLDISRCKNLETLQPLKSVKTLQFVNLSGCVKITDASLLNLVQCKGLDVLYSNHCRRVTRAGLMAMRHAIDAQE